MRLAKTFITWWVLSAALWLLLDDTIALPELIDGAVAAAVGAGAATAAAAAAGPAMRPPRGWVRHGWRPWAALFGDLPALVGVLAQALGAGQRDPGRLRAVAFRPADEPGERAAQIALATLAGSLAPGSVVVAVDPGRAQILVHELVPRTGREGPDPLRLG